MTHANTVKFTPTPWLSKCIPRGGVMHGLSEASVSADRAARGDATATDKVAAGAVDRPYAMIGPRFHMPTAASEERDP